MNPSDRMTIDLLNHYAFVLHENVMDITDEEIEEARKFSDNYLIKSNQYKMYYTDFEMFVNRQRYKGITNYDYKTLEKVLYDKIESTNALLEIYDWQFAVFYNVDYYNCLFLAKQDEYGISGNIILKYDIQNDTLSKCEKIINDEMIELGSIRYSSFGYYEPNNLKF